MNKDFRLFAGIHADSSYISLKTTALLFLFLISLYLAFSHWKKVLACLQLITLIPEISHS